MITYDLDYLTINFVGNSDTTYYTDYHGDLVARECITCRNIDYVWNFFKNRSKFAGIDDQCKECACERIKPYGVLSRNKRRALEAALPFNLTEEKVKYVDEKFKGKCVLSGGNTTHLDHVIPLSIGRGGSLYENMVPLRADLNISKGNRNIFDWFADNRDRFGLEQRKFDELIEYLADINEMTTKEYEEYVRWCHDNPRTVDEIKAEKESENDIA